MNATAAPSAAPKWAVRMWADERSIYCEIPGVNGPYVTAFSRTEGGLSAALHLLGAMQCEYSGEPYQRPTLVPKDLQKRGVTPADFEAAQAVLKKMGII